MRNTIISVLIVFTLISFTACTKNETANGVNAIKSNDDLEIETININEMPWDEVKNIVGFSQDDFNIETDDQVFFDVYHMMTSCKEGYYFVSGDFLYFIDRKTLKTVPLCNKPDCEHTYQYSDCNAYLPLEQYLTDFGLYYYNSNLYILGTDGELDSKSIYLYEISKDGKERNRKFKIVDFGSSVNDMKIHFTVHKGVGYISYGTDKKAELFSFNLDDTDNKLIKLDEIKGLGAEIYRIQGCDKGISYQYGCFTDKNCENFEGGIRVLIDSKRKTIVENAIKTYIIAEGNVYYETANGTEIYDLSSGKTSEFKSDKIANSIMYDGRYFYLYDNMMDNNYKVYVYDKNKKLVNTLNTSQDCKELLFGDKDYFFRLDSKIVADEMAVNLYAIDKSDIEKSTQWQLVYKNEN